MSEGPPHACCLLLLPTRPGSTDRWTACAMSIADLAAIGWSGSGHRMQIFMRRGARSALRRGCSCDGYFEHARARMGLVEARLAGSRRLRSLRPLSAPLPMTNLAAAHWMCVCACMQLAAHHFVWLHTKSSANADADGSDRDCSVFAAGTGVPDARHLLRKRVRKPRYSSSGRNFRQLWCARLGLRTVVL